MRCLHGIPRCVSVRPRSACPCVLACSAAGSWKCLVNPDIAVCWGPFWIPSLVNPFPCGSLPLWIPSHGTGLLPAQNLDLLALGSHWSCVPGAGGPSSSPLVLGDWKSLQCPSAAPGGSRRMECAGVWESCPCYDMGWDVPSPPFPAHPGWLGAAIQVSLHPDNTQASHGRKFSIGLFQAGTFSLLVVQLPTP